jgi:hypothetical protein
MPSIPDSERRSAYYVAAEAEDKRLEDRLTAIRSREDSHMITTLEAANQRIVAMTQHLAAVTELRRAHLEGTS